MQTIDHLRKTILEDPTASIWLRQQALMLSPEKVAAMLCDASILVDLLERYVEQSFSEYPGESEGSPDPAWTLETWPGVAKPRVKRD